MAEAERAARRLEKDERQGYWHSIPVTEGLVRRASERLLAAPPGVVLRSADALHLACAAEEGFGAVYSHDRQMLTAAPCFGLEGRDILAD